MLETVTIFLKIMSQVLNDMLKLKTL